MRDLRSKRPIKRYLPPPLEWPRIMWHAQMWWTFIPFAFGSILFFFPQLTQSSTLVQFRLAIGVPLVLAPLLVPVLLWVSITTTVAAKRVHFYPALNSQAQECVLDNEQLRRSYFDLTQRISDEREFEIIKAGHSDNKLFIVVRKRRAPMVRKGDLLVVVHKEDGLLMGIFRVTEIRSHEIYVTGISDIDPVWSGYIWQRGEIDITPNLAAVHLQQETQDYDNR